MPNSIDFRLDSDTHRVDHTFISVNIDFYISVYVDGLVAIGDGIIDIDIGIDSCDR